MDHSDEHFEWVIPSTYESGQAVVERIVSSVERAGLSGRDLFGVRLALDEAVTNAIKHGNRESPSKSVRIDFRVNPTAIRIEIEDQGEGFRPEQVPDPTTAENLERPNGRGLMLMREFMSRIQYSEKGNRVILEKFRPN